MVDTTRLLAVSGLAAGAVAGVLTGLAEQPAGVVLASAGIPAGLGIAAEVRGHLERRKEEQQRRQREAEEAAAKEQERMRRIAGTLKFWPLHPVAEVDPFTVGVHRPLLPGGHGGDLGAYVPRDVDRDAEAALQATGMLLLVGQPGAGVTRTAWELATRQPGAYRLLAPEPGQLRVAVEELDVFAADQATGRLLVVWLDRIHEHRDVTATLLRHCRERSRGLRVIATIPTNVLEAWKAEHPDLVQTPRRGQEPSPEAFTEVIVAQLLSDGERARAAATHPDLDMMWGVGAAFTGLSSLLDREKAGDTACPFEPAGADCAVARALVHVACFWPATGTTRPLTLPALTDAINRRLGSRGPVAEGHLEHALEWATAPVAEGISPLTSSTAPDGIPVVVAHPGLSDAVAARDQADPGVWQAALDDAHTAGQTEVVGRIGYHAHRSGLLDIAADAWDRIPTLDDPGTRWVRKAADLSDRQHRAAHRIPPLIRLLALTEVGLGPDHLEVAEMLTKLGDARRRMGRSDLARELYERALVIQEQEYGPSHVQTSTTLTKLGGTWIELGWPSRAPELLERALAIQEREYGPHHLEVAKTLTNLGAASIMSGQSNKAPELLERALAIKEREYGPDHFEVAKVLMNLGASLRDLGDFDRSRQLLERALVIEEREYGPYHLQVAGTLTNLGLIWGDLNRHYKARELQERALAIKEREYGPDHFEVAGTLTNLGTTLLAMGDVGRAQELQERALAIAEREYGPDHVQVAAALGSLGLVWARLGHPGRAQELQARALAIAEREYGPDHVEVANALNNLGLSWQELGQPGKARECWEHARRIYLNQDPPRPDDVTRAEQLLRQAAPDVIPLDEGRTAVNPDPIPVAMSEQLQTNYHPVDINLDESTTKGPSIQP